MERTDKEKFYYSLGQLVYAFHELCFSYFFLFFYTSVIGISPAIVGIAIFVSLLIDAINDPFIGGYSDGQISEKWGQRNGLMLFSLPLLSIGLLLSFNPPIALSEMGLVIWMFVCIVFTRSAVSLFFVPYLALGVDMSRDYVERSEIAAWRFLTSSAIILIFAAFFVAVILADSPDYPDGRLNQQGYSHIGWISALASFAFGLICIFKSRKFILSKHQSRSEKWEVFNLNSLKLIMTSKHLIILVLIFSFFSTLVGMKSSLYLYIYSDFWGLSQINIGLLSLTPLLIIFPSFIFTKRITLSYGKKTGLILCMIGFAITFVLPIMFHYLGAFDDLSNTLLLAVVFVPYTIGQFFIISAPMLLYGLAADVTDEVQERFGKSQKGFVLGVVSVCRKSALGLGGLAGGLILQMAQPPRSLDSTETVDVNASYIALLCVIAVIFVVFLFVFTIRYHSLSHANVLAIQKKLQRGFQLDG